MAFCPFSHPLANITFLMWQASGQITILNFYLVWNALGLYPPLDFWFLEDRASARRASCRAPIWRRGTLWRNSDWPLLVPRPKGERGGGQEQTLLTIKQIETSSQTDFKIQKKVSCQCPRTRRLRRTHQSHFIFSGWTMETPNWSVAYEKKRGGKAARLRSNSWDETENKNCSRRAVGVKSGSNQFCEHFPTKSGKKVGRFCVRRLLLPPAFRGRKDGRAVAI